MAKQVRQVAALQGDVLNKTQAVMVLMTVLSLVAAAIAVANLMAASIGERGSELALLKAIGATDGAVSRLMLAETAVISLVGAIAGALLGSGVAQIVGSIEEHMKYRPAVMQAYPAANFPIFADFNHIQYQIRDPKGFADMLISIMDAGKLPELPFITA